MTTVKKYQELSLEQQIQRVRDAWYAKSALPGVEPGWPLHVYTDRLIVEHPDGLFSVPYTVSDDDLISFGDPVKVMQEFVPARFPGEPAGPPHADRRGLPAIAHDFIRTTGRLLGIGDPQDGPGASGMGVRSNTGEGVLLEAPFRVCRNEDEERYVGGLVLTPGDDNAFGDIWEADDIRLMAYRFMEQSRHIDLMHTTKVVAAPVESYYFPTPEEGGQEEYTIYEETVPAGSWWLGSRVQDDDAWELVQSGKLKGYSMFAVKVAKKEGRAGRAYESPKGQAPAGQHMTADEWEITMVSLVDNPAVNKATYVKMRRAPDGQAVITRPGNTPQETEDMRNIRRVAAYHDEHAQAGQDPQDQTPPAGDAAAAAEEQQTPQGEPDAAGVLPAEMAGNVMQMFQNFLEEQVKPLINAAVAPLQQSVVTLETRQARLTGSGALPFGRTANSPADGETPEAPTWTNPGSKPKRFEPPKEKTD